MDLESIINQIQNVLPKYTNDFSESLNVSEMTCIDGVVTITTSEKHLLKTNQYVNIKDAYCSNEITEITLLGNNAIAICRNVHDLTEVWHKTVYITGFDNSALNGEYKLISVDSSKQFTFEIIGKTIEELSGNLILQEKRAGYNGRFKISVVDDYTLSYTTKYNLPSPAFGDIKLLKNVRFSGCINSEAMIEAYTEQPPNNYWGFVVIESAVASKNKELNTDSTYRYEAGQDFKEEIVEQFSVYVFVPTINSLAARPEVDYVRKVIRKNLFKTLLGVKFESGFSEAVTSGVTYVSDNAFDYSKAYYIHRFLFESISTIRNQDIVEPDDTFAFRNFEINYQNVKSNVILNIKGETDY